MPKSIFALFEKNAKNINDAASDIKNTFSFLSFNLFAIFHQLKLNCNSDLLTAVLLTYGNHNAIVLQLYRDILHVWKTASVHLLHLDLFF